LISSAAGGDYDDPVDRTRRNEGTSAWQNVSIDRLKRLSCQRFKLGSWAEKHHVASEENGNKTEQNEEKFLLEPLKKILPSRIRFLNR
jgi:hypothetical protein